MGVELTRPAGGEDHRVGGEALAAVELDADDAAVGDDQVAQQRVFAQLDARGPDSVAESGLDRRSRRVAARVQHARDGVGRLQPPREVAVGGAIEVHAPLDELSDAGRALADEHVHGIRIIQSRAGGQRVGGVRGHGVSGGGDRRDPALRPPRVGVGQCALGHDRDVASALGRVQRRRETGDAAAHHDDGRHFTAPFGLAASMRSRATVAGAATSAGTVMRLTTSPATSDSSTQAR